MKPKAIRRRIRLSLICLILIAAPCFLLPGFFKDSVIINYGIRTWNAVHTACSATGAAAAILGAVMLVSVIAADLKNQNRMRDELQKTRQDEALRQKTSAYLSPDGMDPGLIREKLGQIIAKLCSMDGIEYESLARTFSDLRNQMEEMDGYQLKLKDLLDSNGANALSNMNDMLDQIEQHLLKQMRRVLNLYSMLSLNDKADRQKLASALDATLTQNRDHLSQVKDFLFAVVDFLNKQDENDEGMQTLENYKAAILDTIREQEGTPPDALLLEEARLESEKRQRMQSAAPTVTLSFGKNQHTAADTGGKGDTTS